MIQFEVVLTKTIIDNIKDVNSNEDYHDISNNEESTQEMKSENNECNQTTKDNTATTISTSGSGGDVNGGIIVRTNTQINSLHFPNSLIAQQLFIILVDRLQLLVLQDLPSTSSSSLLLLSPSSPLKQSFSSSSSSSEPPVPSISIAGKPSNNDKADDDKNNDDNQLWKPIACDKTHLRSSSTVKTSENILGQYQLINQNITASQLQQEALWCINNNNNCINNMNADINNTDKINNSEEYKLLSQQIEQKILQSPNDDNNIKNSMKFDFPTSEMLVIKIISLENVDNQDKHNLSNDKEINLMMIDVDTTNSTTDQGKQNDIDDEQIHKHHHFYHQEENNDDNNYQIGWIACIVEIDRVHGYISFYDNGINNPSSFTLQLTDTIILLPDLIIDDDDNDDDGYKNVDFSNRIRNSRSSRRSRYEIYLHHSPIIQSYSSSLLQAKMITIAIHFETKYQLLEWVLSISHLSSTFSYFCNGIQKFIFKNSDSYHHRNTTVSSIATATATTTATTTTTTANTATIPPSSITPLRNPITFPSSSPPPPPLPPAIIYTATSILTNSNTNDNNNYNNGINNNNNDNNYNNDNIHTLHQPNIYSYHQNPQSYDFIHSLRFNSIHMMNVLSTLIESYSEHKICLSHYRTYELKGEDLHSIRFIQYNRDKHVKLHHIQDNIQHENEHQKQQQQQQQYINILMKGNCEQLTEGSLLLSVNGISAITTPSNVLYKFMSDFPPAMMGEFNFFKFPRHEFSVQFIKINHTVDVVGTGADKSLRDIDIHNNKNSSSSGTIISNKLLNQNLDNNSRSSNNSHSSSHNYPNRHSVYNSVKKSTEEQLNKVILKKRLSMLNIENDNNKITSNDDNNNDNNVDSNNIYRIIPTPTTTTTNNDNNCISSSSDNDIGNRDGKANTHKKLEYVEFIKQPLDHMQWCNCKMMIASGNLSIIGSPYISSSTSSRSSSSSSNSNSSNNNNVQSHPQLLVNFHLYLCRVRLVYPQHGETVDDTYISISDHTSHIMIRCSSFHELLYVFECIMIAMKLVGSSSVSLSSSSSTSSSLITTDLNRLYADALKHRMNQGKIVSF